MACSSREDPFHLYVDPPTPAWCESAEGGSIWESASIKSAPPSVFGSGLAECTDDIFHEYTLSVREGSGTVLYSILCRERLDVELEHVHWPIDISRHRSGFMSLIYEGERQVP